MPTYLDLLLTILPVFAIIAIGVVVRRVNWIEAAAEDSLMKIVVNLLFPCLIYDTVAGSAAFRVPANVMLPPLLGFGFTVFGVLICYLGGRAIGLTTGGGLRTFAIAAGICNYGYLPIPIAGALWGRDSQGIVLVHNIGVDTALWTVGVLVMSGLSFREGWRKLVNPIIVSVAFTLLLNALGLASRTPAPLLAVIHYLGVCAVPIGLIMIGVTLADHLKTPGALFDPRVSLGACALRLGLIPLIFLALVRILPVAHDLKRVLVIESVMPSAVSPIILARLYGGRPLTAVQIVLATHIVGILLIPLWIRIGLGWIE